MSCSNGGTTTGEEQLRKMADLSQTLKEGERIIAPTRRPDGTYRKPIRIRPGYVPQDEVAKYETKGALLKKAMASQNGPPGYDPELDTKPKTKSAKRNERKKEKRNQASTENDKNLEPSKREGMPATEDVNNGSESVKSLASQMNELAVSSTQTTVSCPSDSIEGSNPEDMTLDIDKKIRALKKKVRLTEAQLQKTAQDDMKPEQLEKLTKLEGWREEIKLLEDKKAKTATAL